MSKETIGEGHMLIGTYKRDHHRFKQMSDKTVSIAPRPALKDITPDTPMALRQTINELEKENFDLVAKCIALIGKLGWSSSPDGRVFTFPDGDTWNEFNPEPEDDNDE